MEQRQLGRSGLRVSRLALGTMNWGLDTDANDAADQLVAFRDAGGTLVDTADVYQDGHSEHILGSLLGTVVPRDDIIVATKAGAHRHNGPFGTGTSRGALLNALHGSLRRLRVDHIDLWQLHTWDPSVPLQETLDALDTAVTSGKVRYVGISNHTGWQLATTATLSRTTRTALSSLQTEYSLVERTAEHEIAPAADHHANDDAVYHVHTGYRFVQKIRMTRSIQHRNRKRFPSQGRQKQSSRYRLYGYLHLLLIRSGIHVPEWLV